jgi:multiple sugar transport system substrate-binding protein
MSKVSRRQFLHWATVVSGGAALAACASPTQEPDAASSNTEQSTTDNNPPAAETVTVSWWNPDHITWQKGYEDIAALVTEKYPHINVKINNVPEEGFAEKVTSMIAADDGPDVWAWFYSVDTAKRGFMAPLDKYIQADNIDMDKLWFPICKLRGEYDGKHYGTPRDGFWNALVYNKDLFDQFGVDYPQAGWTTDDFVAKAVALTDEDKETWGTTFGDPGSLAFDIAFCWNLGFELVSENGKQVKGLLDSEKSIWAIQWMLDLREKYKVSPSGSMMESFGEFPFGGGKIGMSTGSVELLKSLTFNFGQVECPVKPGVQQYAWGDSVQYYMWSGSKVQDAAWALMKTASSVEGTTIPMKANLWSSPCPQTWLDLGADKDPVTGPLWLEAQKPTKVPNYLRTEFNWECVWPNYEDIWTRYIENGERPLDKLVQEAAELAQSCLDARNAELG